MFPIQPLAATHNKHVSFVHSAPNNDNVLQTTAAWQTPTLTLKVSL